MPESPERGSAWSLWCIKASIDSNSLCYTRVNCTNGENVIFITFGGSYDRTRTTRFKFS
ncbi:hypothetical protein BH09ACT8_BH09ACT8_49550 [soil metagenome]